MITEQRLYACLTVFIGVLLCASCDNPTGSEPIPLAACDPVQPRPPCDPSRTSDPRRVRTIAIVDGDTQVANTGSALPKPLTVLVTDGSNAPLPNVVVRWSAGSNVTLSNSTSSTDANGLARVQLTLGNNAGEFTTVATIDGRPDVSTQFVSVAQVNGAFRIRENTGDSGLDQADTVLARLPRPYKVRVTDYTGAPVAGVAVEWSLYSSGALSATTSTTDENGVAQVTHTLGSRAGFHVVQASAAGLVGSPFGFSTYAGPGRPVSITAVRGGDELSLINKEVGPYVVHTTDAHGNGTTTDVHWRVQSGGGSLVVVNPLTAIHTLGPELGEQNVTASLGATGAHVTFTANAFSAIVAINDCYYGPSGFDPSESVISPGGMILWLWWQDYCPDAHNVTFEDDPAPPASSGTHQAARFARVFSTPGIFRYRCTLHSKNFDEGEVGVVKVE